MTAYAYSITPYIPGNNNTIRSAADVGSGVVGALKFGTKAYGNEIVGDGVIERWLHILDWPGKTAAQTDGWVAEIHAGKKIATIATVGTPPPPPPPTTSDLASIKMTAVVKDAAGNVIGSYATDETPFHKA